MQIEVRVFAHLRQVTKKGNDPFIVSLEKGNTVNDLICHLQLEEEQSLIVMVNGKRQTEDFPLKEGDRVGIFPPVGGG